MPLSAKRLLRPKWQVLSAMSSMPAWEKWASTLAPLSRAMVISEMHISRKALKVAKIPCGPLHAETRGGGEVGAFHDAAAHEDLRVGLADLGQAAGALQIAVHTQHLVLACFRRHGGQDLHQGVAEHVAVGLHALAAAAAAGGVLRLGDRAQVVGSLLAAPLLEVAIALSTGITSWPWVEPSMPAMPTAIGRRLIRATGPSLSTAWRRRRWRSSRSSPSPDRVARP
jgi:hypothetical protein